MQKLKLLVLRFCECSNLTMWNSKTDTSKNVTTVENNFSNRHLNGSNARMVRNAVNTWSRFLTTSTQSRLQGACGVFSETSKGHLRRNKTNLHPSGLTGPDTSIHISNDAAILKTWSSVPRISHREGRSDQETHTEPCKRVRKTNPRFFKQSRRCKSVFPAMEISVQPAFSETFQRKLAIAISGYWYFRGAE